jgi:hypothetical protein
MASSVTIAKNELDHLDITDNRRRGLTIVSAPRIKVDYSATRNDTSTNMSWNQTHNIDIILKHPDSLQSAESPNLRRISYHSQ